MSADDLDDLLGPPVLKRVPPRPPQPERRPGRPSKAYLAAKQAWDDWHARYGDGAAPAAEDSGVDLLEAEIEAQQAAAEEGDDEALRLGRGQVPDATAFFRPVTRTYLATLLNRQPRHIVKQLSRCPVIGYTAKGLPLYDFAEAMSYCIEPKIDLMLWLKAQNAMSLPPHINKAFWDAMRSRQMVEERAGDLWRTADVLDVLARTALTIKETATLWIESLPDKDLLTTEQYESIRGAVNDLLTEVHRRLVEMPTHGAHRATSAEFERMVQEGSREALGLGLGEG